MILKSISHPNVRFYAKHCVAASPSNRIDCGYPGITASQCHKKKCCWDETTKGVPFCYQATFNDISRL